MQRRAPRTPDPADATRLVPHGAPRLLLLRWWLLAPALLVATALGGALYLRAHYESFEDDPAPAMARVHETPWFLWTADGPGGPLVSTFPSGDPVTGTWRAISETTLLGNWVLADDDGDAELVVWGGEPTTFVEDVDGVLWREFVRRPVRADFEALGRDPQLVGSWNIDTTFPGCTVIRIRDLRPDGTMPIEFGRTVRWAGAGRLLLLAPEYATPNIPFEVLVENPRVANERGATRWFSTPTSPAGSKSVWRDRD